MGKAGDEYVKGFRLLKIADCLLSDLNHVIECSALPESHFDRLMNPIIEIGL